MEVGLLDSYFSKLSRSIKWKEKKHKKYNRVDTSSFLLRFSSTVSNKELFIVVL